MAAARVTRTREVAPDPSIAKAVGRHHTFETAIADLVDNSLDAGASRVLIRFLQDDGATIGLQVIDDGRGMDGGQLDEAMEFAKKRAYRADDQGHFGLGLKAASLSQADRLDVYSRRHGAVAAGRTITADAPTRIGELEGDDVESVLTGMRIDFPLGNGTVVEWARPRTFLSSTDARDRAQWLETRVQALRTHLGIVFHRHLASAGISISIDVFDVALGESGAARRITPIDPFGYTPLPNDEFPAQLVFDIDGSTGTGMAHIWPAAQTGLPEFRLAGRPGSLAQGLYFYRNDRLLQVGSWNTLAVERPELEHVRIAIDIDDLLKPHVTINPEKAGLELDSDLRQALLAARLQSSGASLREFLAAAESRRRDSRRYTKQPVRLVAPGRGLSGVMREAFDDSVEPADAPPIDIRWTVEASEAPVRIDLENRTIWLNSAYRGLIAGDGAADNEDASFVKTLLLMHYSKYFEGSYLGSREKSEIDAWEQLLTAAVRDESARQEKELRDDER